MFDGAHRVFMGECIVVATLQEVCELHDVGWKEGSFTANIQRGLYAKNCMSTTRANHRMGPQLNLPY